MNTFKIHLAIVPLLLCLLMITGCNNAQLSKEAMALQEKGADEVAFTYEQISAMSQEELKQNIQKLSDQLEAKRSKMPRSLAGATMGSNDPVPNIQKENSTELPPEAEGDEPSVESLALPLEVMRQMLDSNS